MRRANSFVCYQRYISLAIDTNFKYKSLKTIYVESKTFRLFSQVLFKKFKITFAL